MCYDNAIFCMAVIILFISLLVLKYDMLIRVIPFLRVFKYLWINGAQCSPLLVAILYSSLRIFDTVELSLFLIIKDTTPELKLPLKTSTYFILFNSIISCSVRFEILLLIFSWLFLIKSTPADSPNIPITFCVPLSSPSGIVFGCFNLSLWVPVPPSIRGSTLQSLMSNAPIPCGACAGTGKDPPGTGLYRELSG